MKGLDWGDLTEDQAYVVLQRFFAAAAERHERHEEPGWLSPHPRSPLAADDEALGRVKLSHIAARAIAAGNDHLLGMKHLLETAQILPAYAVFPLIRAAIECAAVALWVVGPEDPHQRRINALRWALQDKRDEIEFAGRFQGKSRKQRARKFEAAAQPLYEIGDRANISRDALELPLHSSTMITADHVPHRGGVGALTAWSAASGFAHGRDWPILYFQQASKLPSSRAGEVRAKVTADARLVATFTIPADELLSQAEVLAEKRAVAPQPSPGLMRIVMTDRPSRP